MTNFALNRSCRVTGSLEHVAHPAGRSQHPMAIPLPKVGDEGRVTRRSYCAGRSLSPSPHARLRRQGAASWFQTDQLPTRVDRPNAYCCCAVLQGNSSFFFRDRPVPPDPADHSERRFPSRHDKALLGARIADIRCHRHHAQIIYRDHPAQSQYAVCPAVNCDSRSSSSPEKRDPVNRGI